MKSCLCRVSYSKIMLISKYMWVTCQQWYFKFTDNYFYLKTCTSFLREWQSAKAGWYLINTCDLSSGHFAFCRYNVVWDIIAWDDRDDDNNYGDDDGDDLKPDAVEDVAIWKDANVNVWHEDVVEPPLLLIPATTTVQIHQRDKRLNIWGKIQNIYIDWSTWKRCPASTPCQHRSLSSTWSGLRPRILYWLIFRRARQPTFHVGFAQLVGIGQTIIGPLLPGNRGQRLNKRSSCHLKVIWTLYSILTSSIFAKLRMNRFTMIKVASSEKIN